MDDDDGRPFTCTFRNEFYMTETQAFCGAGKVKRFMVPDRSPLCVRRGLQLCGCTRDSGTLAALAGA